MPRQSCRRHGFGPHWFYLGFSERYQFLPTWLSDQVNSGLVEVTLTARKVLIFLRFFKLIILCRFFGTLFLPEFLSNHYGIWTPYPQSCRKVCYNFSKSSSMFFQDYPGFSGSLYYWMPKDSFCLLVKWADTALGCPSNAKGSICLLVKWEDTAFWFARQ